MDKNILNFFRRSVYGTNYDLSKPDDIDMICRCCFVNAWKDMARTYKNDDTEKRTKLKDSFLADLTEQVKSQKYEPRKIILKYENQNKLTLGQSQKVVNMFFKYLYTFLDNPIIVKEQFENCDCPIDSIILELISCKQKEYKNISFTNTGKLKYKNKNYVWSKIDNFDLYTELQELIAILSKGTKLDFDFDEWK